MSDITMPTLSPTMEEGTLLKWHVKVGDSFSAGDVVAEIETDKATMEVEAVDDGKMTEILVEEGTEKVPVGSVIARYLAEGEEESAAPPAKEDKPPAKEAKAEPAPAPETAPKPAAETSAPAPAPEKAQKGNRIIASPLARRLAKERGIDLAALSGSGPHGRIVRADVEAAGSAQPAAVAPDTATQTVTDSSGDTPYERLKLSSMRKTIARRLTQSKQEVPHYYLTVDLQLDELLKLRSQLNKALEAQRIRISVNDMLVKALGLALMQVPDANVSFMGDHLRQYQRADISVAVAIPGGLITPIVRGADSRRLSEISTMTRDLGRRAKEGKLQPEEFTGGTASISNLGMFGVREFSAVINPPQGLILAIGAAGKRPVVIDDELRIATIMTVTGSFDHRAVDGAVGARLLAAFKELIENPVAMLV